VDGTSRPPQPSGATEARRCALNPPAPTGGHRNPRRTPDRHREM